ncbi:hypothetical protein [Streptomyces sp. NPDC026673]|uniref:hypothetical protein n=1 Tax=Streptomyces sp. NPDC026673 TaxID=3155724 RepID=UPI003405D1BD
MRTRTAVLAVLLLAAPITACGGSEPDTAACEAALVRQVEDATAEDGKGTRPEACAGVDDKTLEHLAGEATTERPEDPEAARAAEEAFESALPTPSVAASITPECRKWIEKELRSPSDIVDAAPGYAACGYLSKEQLDEAIDDAIEELIEEGAGASS